MRRLTQTAGLLLALFGCAGERVERQAVETIRLPETLLRLETDIHDGDVRLRGSEGPAELVIERRAWAGSAEAAEAALDRLAVRADLDPTTGAFQATSHDLVAGVPAFLFGESVSLTLTFRIPPGTPVRIRVRDGNLNLEGLTGPVDAWTADGRVLARRVGAADTPVRLGSGDGRIDGRDLRGRIDAETADGSIRLEGRLEEVTAFTADGRVEVDGRRTERITGDWRIRNADGGVTLMLPEGLPAHLDVTAGEGVRGDAAADRDALFFQRSGPAGAPHILIVAPDGPVRLSAGDPDS